jgi:hypothetical protein
MYIGTYITVNRKPSRRHPYRAGLALFCRFRIRWRKEADPDLVVECGTPPIPLTAPDRPAADRAQINVDVLDGTSVRRQAEPQDAARLTATAR